MEIVAKVVATGSIWRCYVSFSGIYGSTMHTLLFPCLKFKPRHTYYVRYQTRFVQRSPDTTSGSNECHIKCFQFLSCTVTYYTVLNHVHFVGKKVTVTKMDVQHMWSLFYKPFWFHCKFVMAVIPSHAIYHFPFDRYLKNHDFNDGLPHRLGTSC